MENFTVMFNKFNIDKTGNAGAEQGWGLLAKPEKDSLSCVQKVGSGSVEAGSSVSQFSARRQNMQGGSAVTKQWRNCDIMSRRRTKIKTKWLVMVR